MNKRPAVFLDKDGTLIPDIPYNVDPARITLYPDAGPALRRLREAGFRLVVVSNQAGVARGYFAESALGAVWQKLTDLLVPFGVAIDGFYYCPNHPQGVVAGYVVDCNFRKPKPGMLLQAARERNLDLARSWMVGDILNDVEAGNRAGCRTVLLNRGYETEWQPGDFRTPTVTATSLWEAAELILQRQRAAGP